MAAASILLVRWGSEGPAAWLVKQGAATGTELGVKQLRQAFCLSVLEVGLGLKASAIGVGKADALPVNVALSFLGAWWQRVGDTQRWREVAALYCSYPGLWAYGVVRRMVQELGLPRAGLPACQQQGLHHVFRRYCLMARYKDCPLGRLGATASGKPEAGVDV